LKLTVEGVEPRKAIDANTIRPTATPKRTATVVTRLVT
jgi:hypothetical protein